MNQVGTLHLIYMALILLMMVTIMFKKEIILLSIISIGLIGYLYFGSALKGMITIYLALVVSAKEFAEVIVIIALVYAMSEALKEIKADQYILAPLKKGMRNPSMAFIILVITMSLFSWFIWPTPAVAFLGSLLVPAAREVGLPSLWIAVALSLSGKGIALSSDFFIQAAPSITAKTANITEVGQLIRAGIPFWLTMSIVTISTAFLLMRKDLKKKRKPIQNKQSAQISKISIRTKIIAILTFLSFLVSVGIIYFYELKGIEATALIGGNAFFITTFSSLLNFGFHQTLEKIPHYLQGGLLFGMKVFAPIILIASFFFLGNKATATAILGTPTGGWLEEVGLYAAQTIPLTKWSVISMQTTISALLGVGGSGFGGLPLIGTLAQTFSVAVPIPKERIAALGQVITIWIGGGSIIPWSVVPVAAICEVSPFELAKKNIIPIVLGSIATFIIALWWG